MNRMHIRRHLPGKTTRRGGIATLEMALMLLLLLNIAFGTVEFGYFFFIKNTCENAAREGCRASIGAGAQYSDITSAVQTALTQAGQTASNYTITVMDNSTTVTSLSSAAVGDSISVSVSGTWSVVGQGFRPLLIIAGTRSVTGVTVMRKEG